MPLYELHNVTQGYNGQTVLSIDHWQVDARTVTGVAGPNGSGKSTLLALLGYVAAPVRGTVLFNGRPAVPFAGSVRGRVALLPQDSFLLKRSVQGNIAYGLRMARVRGDLLARVAEAMAMVGLDPANFGRRPWWALSGGEARRVALAARLALKPQVLLMDEPTLSVDAASAQLIKEAAMHARQQWGTTLVITSHDAEWLADICDDMVHLFRGRLMASGMQTLIFGPWEKQADGLVGRALAPGHIFLAGRAPQDLDSAVAAIAAEQLTLHTQDRSPPAGRHCLEGLLLRLSYEQNTRRTSAAVQVGRSVLKAYLSPSASGAPTIRPGQTIRVAYDPDTVQWY
jgi:tungstate transport system ATP-binding protein